MEPTNRFGLTPILLVLAALSTVASFWIPGAWILALVLITLIFIVEQFKITRGYVRPPKGHITGVRCIPMDKHLETVSELTMAEKQLVGLGREFDRVIAERNAMRNASDDKVNMVSALLVSLEAADKSARQICEAWAATMKPDTAARRMEAWKDNSGRYAQYMFAALQDRALRQVDKAVFIDER